MLQPVPFHQLVTLTMLPSSSWQLLIITDSNTISWHCQSLSQISSMNRQPSCPIGLLSSLTVLLGDSLPYLSTTTLTSSMLPLWEEPSKDSHSHFTIYLQICHQNIMLQVMITKHFWKQNTCYTDITPVIGVPVIPHCFFMLYLLLFNLLPS